jgi:O-antigen/teichoic acid export membrane protein
MARFLSPADVGTYGLLAGTITYAVYVLGIDYYTYTTREIIRVDQTQWRSRVLNHSVLTGCVYAIALPLLLLVFTAGLLPWTLAAWFFALAIFEHLSTELNRLLVAMSQQFAASVVLFIRQGVAPIATVSIMFGIPAMRSLPTVLGVWISFDALGVLIGLIYVLRYTRNSVSVRFQVDWAWIKRGLPIAFRFLLGTLLLRAFTTVDRYLVDWGGTRELLGVYTFFIGATSAIGAVLSVTVFQFTYPRLVKAAMAKSDGEFKRGVRAMLLQTTVIVGLIDVVALALERPLLAWIGQDIYQKHWWVLPIALAVATIQNLSYVPHYGLYALDGDRAIVGTTAVSVVLFLTVSIIWIALTGGQGLLAVLVGLLAAYAVMVIGKTWCLRKLWQKRWHASP